MSSIYIAVCAKGSEVACHRRPRALEISGQNNAATVKTGHVERLGFGRQRAAYEAAEDSHTGPPSIRPSYAVSPLKLLPCLYRHGSTWNHPDASWRPEMNCQFARHQSSLDVFLHVTCRFSSLGVVCPFPDGTGWFRHGVLDGRRGDVESAGRRARHCSRMSLWWDDACKLARIGCWKAVTAFDLPRLQSGLPYLHAFGFVSCSRTHLSCSSPP